MAAAPRKRPPAPAVAPQTGVLDILAALDSQDLFGGMFDGASWRPWRVFLGALFALPLDDEDAATYRHHTGRTALPTVPFREACLVCGRRGGKSRILGLIATYLACCLDHSSHTAPGETPVVAIIAADRRQAKVIFQYIIGILRAVPLLDEMIIDELSETVRLSNGISIEIHTSSIGAPSGRTFVAILADECAFWSTGDVANPDKAIIAAVRPGLATLPYSMLLVASSPYARRGFLFETFSRYFGKDAAPVLVWRGTTREMNSCIDLRIIEEAFEADPESAEAEYNANFRSDITAFIDRNAVEAVVAHGCIEVPPAVGTQYCAFVDPSGGSADSMTLAIAHMAPDGTAILDATRERKPPFSPEDVTVEFCTLLKSYAITRVSGDAYAGEWRRERFATHGIGYEVSSRNKNAIYQDFLPALNGRRVRLLDQPRLIAQLCNLERRVSRGGRDSIDHGPGQHDDVGNSVCGALTLVINDRRPALIRRDAMLLDNAPVPMPTWASCVFSTLIVGGDGMTAAAHFAYLDRQPLILLDFIYEPLSGGTIPGVYAGGEALCRQIGRIHRGHFVYLPETMRAFAKQQGRDAEAIPASYLADPAALAMTVAGHVAAGGVKICAQAASKAESAPLAGALDFRGGERIDDNPLRMAVLCGVALSIVQLR